MYLTDLSAPPRFQWEDNSAPSQSNNCGPTCATHIACFFRDRWYGIEATRRLVAGPYTPTTYQQQADMLTARGVPSTLVNVTSLAQLHALVGSGKRPVILAMLMSRVPASVRGHSFLFWHAVVCRDDGVYNGTTGFWINDPNFSAPGGYRTDPTGGKRFYSDAVMKYAFIDNNQHWAIVPNAAKYIPPPPPAPVAKLLADGDPYPMRYRRISPDNDRFQILQVRAGKPVRAGASVGSTIYTTVTKNTPFSAFGYIPKLDLPLAEQKYGNVYIGSWYHVNGDHLGYLKQVDAIIPTRLAAAHEEPEPFEQPEGVDPLEPVSDDQAANDPIPSEDEGDPQ